ncbi:MAG: ADP-ribosylglycohydrolase family protein [Anaerolineaceae bacterium]|nr:ADP-ribosylglycohydrolase family protein [Anaerolineaceae bacterium]
MIPRDYDERVYAGWLGKCIGVRFGAPLENWTYEEICDNLGELRTYLREDAGKIFKPDDDTALPMILIRAFEDYGASPAITAQDFGETWLNYLGDEHGTLWWGGYGVSTEHTAYRNLAAGIPAPLSGSIALNGATLAEQIGGQIFSDIFGLIAPGDPALAADLAEIAASVAHDRNGIYGGRFLAAMVSAAFTERDPLALLHSGLGQIPAASEYARVITAMMEYHREHPEDWRSGYTFLKANFGYDRYSGVVHIIPNAGVIALALLYGGGDFSRSIQIANMAGWDTDCNVGNVGAVLGVAVGLEGIDTAWREPMNDLLITASITGTRNILTIPGCADLFTRIGRAFQGEDSPARPRYHFAYPGATSNFSARGKLGRPIHQTQRVVDGIQCLQTSIRKLNKKGEMQIGTRTTYHPGELSSNYYGATFTPLISPGQTLHAEVYIPANAPETIQAALYAYDEYGQQRHQATGTPLVPGEWHTLDYTLPELTDASISEVGVLLRNTGGMWETGAFYLKSLDWDGTPAWRTTFAHERPETGGISQWTRVRGYWRLEDGAYHGSGPGICETYTGDAAWADYTLHVEITPLLGDYHGALVRVGGARRGYAACLSPGGQVTLYRNDGGYSLVASAPYAWQHGRAYTLSVTATGRTITATISDGDITQRIQWVDAAPYPHGQIGLCNWHGSHTHFTAVSIGAASPDGGQHG